MLVALFNVHQRASEGYECEASEEAECSTVSFIARRALIIPALHLIGHGFQGPSSHVRSNIAHAEGCVVALCKAGRQLLVTSAPSICHAIVGLLDRDTDWWFRW